MRYPDKIAYHVTIDSALEQLELPKFTLQPLVENYFVHGIDYQRNDNAISIKAYKEVDQIVIEVKDNGKGADAQQLAMIQEELQNQEIGAQTSIGIKMFTNGCGVCSTAPIKWTLHLRQVLGLRSRSA